MAEDNLTEIAPDTKTTVTARQETPEKPVRAARRKTAGADANIKPVTTSAKQPVKRKTRGETSVPADLSSTAAVELAASAASSRRRRGSAIAEPTAAAVEALPAADEMTDLLQLEAENARLRKLLSNKLRQENSDLRKKLGMN